MRIHLVGGFLGSGKTTAIIAAARRLMDEGQRVGIVTNDQGKYLVDTGFFQLSDLPTVEVTGGCFCCHYDDLNARLDQLTASHQPDVIFAESVGSCADLVATVLKPLLELRMLDFTPASLSVFADSRLLRLRLLDEAMPFNEDVCYIFDQQIEEAGLLVVNKIDLLTTARLDQLRQLVEQRYPGKAALFQNSLAAGSAETWLRRLASEESGVLPSRSLSIDYARYGAGEGRLAWLDHSMTLHLPPAGDARAVLQTFIAALLAELQTRGAAIGHIKFLAHSSAGGSCKLSFTTLPEAGWQANLPALAGDQLTLVTNARVEMDAGELHRLFDRALAQIGVEYTVESSDFFQPGQPKPTHRMA